MVASVTAQLFSLRTRYSLPRCARLTRSAFRTAHLL